MNESGYSNANQQVQSASTVGYYQPQPVPCPTCGRCPTCGQYDKRTYSQMTWSNQGLQQNLQQNTQAGLIKEHGGYIRG